MKIEALMWKVQFTLPAQAGVRRFISNQSVICLCPTLEDAVAHVRQEYPEATIYSVVHEGKKTVLVLGTMAERGFISPVDFHDLPTK